MVSPVKKSSHLQRAGRWLRRLLLAIAGFALFYGCFLLLGFVPVNRGYSLPPVDNRVRLFIHSSDIHTDILMPVTHEELGIDWRGLFPPDHFSANVSGCKYVAVGWGARSFYIETPTWSDLKLTTALRVLCLPSQAVLHAEYLVDAAPDAATREVLVTREQYRELADFVRASVAGTDEQGAARSASDFSYGPGDHFYLATGSYHMFNTCNQWTGRGLKQAGVPTGIWTPLRAHVLCWLPEPSQ